MNLSLLDILGKGGIWIPVGAWMPFDRGDTEAVEVFEFDPLAAAGANPTDEEVVLCFASVRGLESMVVIVVFASIGREKSFRVVAGLVVVKVLLIRPEAMGALAMPLVEEVVVTGLFRVPKAGVFFEVEKLGVVAVLGLDAQLEERLPFTSSLVVVVGVGRFLFAVLGELFERVVELLLFKAWATFLLVNIFFLIIFKKVIDSLFFRNLLYYSRR